MCGSSEVVFCARIRVPVISTNEVRRNLDEKYASYIHNDDNDMGKIAVPREICIHNGREGVPGADGYRKGWILVHCSGYDLTFQAGAGECRDFLAMSSGIENW